MAEPRPECWDFAMSFLGEPEASAITQYVEGLEIAHNQARAADIELAKLPDYAIANEVRRRAALAEQEVPNERNH